MTTRCRSCNAELIWATTEKGKPIPLDAEPVADGNIRLEERSVSPEGVGEVSVQEIVLTAVYTHPGEGSLFHTTSPLYVSHFATCKDAKKWRKA